MVEGSSPEVPSPTGLLDAADVSDSPHFDEALSWVTTEEVQPSDPLAGEFDHAAWIDESAIATVGTVAAASIADDVAGHRLVDQTKHEDPEVLYVKAPSLTHGDVQLLTAAALASRVPVSVPPLQPTAPVDESEQPNPFFVVTALGLVALIIAAFATGGWLTSQREEELPIALSDAGAMTTVPGEGPVGAIASATTTAPPSTTEPPSATTTPPTTAADEEAVLAAATQALQDAGFNGIVPHYENGTVVLEGVLPTDNLGSGYFAQVDQVTSVIAGIEGVDQVSARLFLRGDDARLRAKLNTISEETPIEFESASADLTPASRAALRSVADAILANPGLRVLVAGHTDATGSPEANAQLGGARAETVILELARLGVPITRLQPVAYGELFPDAAGTDAENRRVEFEVAP